MLARWPHPSCQRKECLMPSKEHEGSSIVGLRLSDDLLERLDRYLDRMETARREKASRNHAIRAALSLWLDQQNSRPAWPVLTKPDETSVRPPTECDTAKTLFAFTVSVTPTGLTITSMPCLSNCAPTTTWICR